MSPACGSPNKPAKIVPPGLSLAHKRAERGLIIVRRTGSLNGRVNLLVNGD